MHVNALFIYILTRILSRSKGVKKIYKLDAKQSVPKTGNSQVFLIGANAKTFRIVLEQIHGHESGKITSTTLGLRNYHIIIVPFVPQSFHTMLEEEGLYGLVTLHRFSWDFIYLDEGVMSLEIPQVFPDVFICKDTSSLTAIAHSFRLFDLVIGKPDLILSYGENSEKILNMVERLEKSNAESKPSDFSAMIIIDRDKDYPSCLLTPAIYSGLLLEVFKYKSGELDIQEDSNRIANGKIQVLRVPPATPVKSVPPTVLRMNSSYDEIYAENRYKHFAEASNLVRSQAKALGVEVQNINKMKLNEMQDYVSKKLPKITEMKNKITKHLNVCEQVINELAGNFQKQQSLEDDVLNNTNRKRVLTQIDEILTIDGHKFNVIRMMCLVHIAMSLSSDELSVFMRNYCNAFGHKYLYIFHRLAKANLLPDLDAINKSKLRANLQIPMFQQTEFQINANRLKLLAATPDKSTPNNEAPKACASYVFNGLYIPLAAQMISFLLRAQNFDDFCLKMGALEGVQMRLKDLAGPKELKQIQQALKKKGITDKLPLRHRTIFVFVVGGISYAEISACNLVSKITGSKIVVASNCIWSGSDLIASAF